MTHSTWLTCANGSLVPIHSHTSHFCCADVTKAMTGDSIKIVAAKLADASAAIASLQPPVVAGRLAVLALLNQWLVQVSASAECKFFCSNAPFYAGPDVPMGGRDWGGVGDRAPTLQVLPMVDLEEVEEKKELCAAAWGYACTDTQEDCGWGLREELLRACCIRADSRIFKSLFRDTVKLTTPNGSNVPKVSINRGTARTSPNPSVIEHI